MLICDFLRYSFLAAEHAAGTDLIGREGRQGVGVDGAARLEQADRLAQPRPIEGVAEDLVDLAAARTDIDASVGYYGVMIDQMLNESHAIANHLVLHIAGDDGFVPPVAQQAMHAGLDDHPKVTLYDYPGLDHGFAAEMGNRRDEEGARLADSRTEAFFAEQLG